MGYLMISIVSVSLVVPISTNKTKWTVLPLFCCMNSAKQKTKRVKDTNITVKIVIKSQRKRAKKERNKEELQKQPQNN